MHAMIAITAHGHVRENPHTEANFRVVRAAGAVAQYDGAAAINARTLREAPAKHPWLRQQHDTSAGTGTEELVVPFASAMTAAPNNCATTPLPLKLGVVPGRRVAVMAAPAGFADQIEGAPFSTRLRGSFDVVIQFATSRATLERRLGALVAALEPRGGLWIAWPKRSSGVRCDLDESTVRGLGLATGLVDNKVCAIDETWSGLRFVRRRSAR
jgi:hypothetical protein